jgi:hypothetical protein
MWAIILKMLASMAAARAAQKITGSQAAGGVASQAVGSYFGTPAATTTTAPAATTTTPPATTTTPDLYETAPPSAFASQTAFDDEYYNSLIRKYLA